MFLSFSAIAIPTLLFISLKCLSKQANQIMWKERTRKPYPNPKPLEKLRIVDSGPFFPHDPVNLPGTCLRGQQRYMKPPQLYEVHVHAPFVSQCADSIKATSLSDSLVSCFFDTFLSRLASYQYPQVAAS